MLVQIEEYVDADYTAHVNCEKIEENWVKVDEDCVKIEWRLYEDRRIEKESDSRIVED